jgi:hypothetical protein
LTKTKLNYRFHNPNTAEASAEYLLRLFIEANADKVEEAVRQSSQDSAEQSENDEEQRTYTNNQATHGVA